MPCCFDAKAECVVCVLQILYAFVQSERHNFQFYFGTTRRFNYLIFPLKSHSRIHSHATQAIGLHSARDISIRFYMQQGQCGKYRDKMVYHSDCEVRISFHNPVMRWVNQNHYINI